MLITSNQIAIRDQQRAELERAVAEHLAAGGTIERLSHSERAPHRPISYNRSVTHKPSVRRQYQQMERKIAEHGRALAAVGLTVEQARRQMAQKWDASLTGPRLEQIAAKYGYAYQSTPRGRS